MADEHKTQSRVIAHFDIDCFYAQSEELRCPSLRGRPVGVTQKFLVVTSNYVARSLGVPKMVSIAEAKRKLPTLVLVNGEDLTPYRADSKRIMAILRRFGTLERCLYTVFSVVGGKQSTWYQICEWDKEGLLFKFERSGWLPLLIPFLAGASRHGLDEGAVDITVQVEARLQSGFPTISFSGHVLGLESPERTSKGPQTGTLFNFESMQLNLETLSTVDVSLLVGSQVVAEMRKAIEKETGFRCSCGIAQNKMLAKLSSSLNKPSMQTCLLQGAVAEFLAPMSVRKIPGVGHQMQGVLAGMNVETILDLGKVTLKQLSERLGDRIALMLFNAARGEDLSPVQDKGPPKSISVEDSFRNCQTMQQAVEILRVLAPDLIRRLDEDREETGRRPRSFTLKWRVQGTKWNFISVSTQMPSELLSTSVTVDKRAFLAVDVATKLLSRNLQEPFHLVVLNIGASNFESTSSSPGVSDIRSFLQGKGNSPEKELKVISKRDARANRESFKTMANNALLTGGAPTPSTIRATKQRGPLQKWKAWDVPSEVQFEDDHHLFNSSEDEEEDDLADQLKLTTRGSSSKQRDQRTTQIQARAAEFLQQESFQEQDTKLSNRIQPSVPSVDFRSRLPVSSGKVDETTLYTQVKVADSVIVITPTEQSFLPSKVASQVPMSVLYRHHHGIDGAVPLSGKPLEAHGSSEASSGKSGTLVRISTPDIKNLMNTNSGNNSRSSDGSESRLKPLMEMSSLSHHPRSSINGPGSEHANICEQCGELVEDTESGQQQHADYHFALSLDKQERISLQLSPGLTRVPSTAKRDRVVHSPTPSKKSKSKNGTLDGFVVRRP